MSITLPTKAALVLAPPFWPNLPPLSMINIGSFLLSRAQSISLHDLNNKFFNLAEDTLKKEWLVSANASLESRMPELLKKVFARELDAVLNDLAQLDVIGFSCYKSNMRTTLFLAEMLKNKNPILRVAFGGPEITRYYLKGKESLQADEFAAADLLVVGEGEKPFYDFVQNNVSGRMIYFEELDDINSYDPAAAYGLLDIKAYPRKDSVSLLMGRGCLKTCRFCSERFLYKKQRIRSIDNIIKEISFHLKRNSRQSFVFHDSMLNMNLARLERLCDAIIKKFGRINWEAQMGVRLDMSDGLLEKIAKSGCYNLFIGLESGCDNTLANMRKGFTSMDALMFFKKLKKANLTFGVSMIVGFPQETEEECEESLRFLIDNQEYIPKIEQINPFVYYEGTDVDKNSDFYHNRQLAGRAEYFIEQLKKHRFKMTKAFINNLVDAGG